MYKTQGLYCDEETKCHAPSCCHNIIEIRCRVGSQVALALLCELEKRKYLQQLLTVETHLEIVTDTKNL